MMLNLAHISDLHFGKPYIARLGEALHDTILRMSPDVLVIGGDLTQRAKPREFQAARHFLDRLSGMPHVVVPGNHDVPLYRVLISRLSAVLAGYPALVSMWCH